MLIQFVINYKPLKNHYILYNNNISYIKNGNNRSSKTLLFCLILNSSDVNNFFIKSSNILLKIWKNVHPNTYTTMQHSRPKCIVIECTEVGFASFLSSGGFTISGSNEFTVWSDQLH